MKLCICGGGGVGTVICGVAADQGHEVRLLSPRADSWSDEITVLDCYGKSFTGKLAAKSSDPAEVVPDSDCVLLCLPGYLIRQTLEKIRPYLSKNAIVGSVVSSSGFFFEAREILGPGTPLFGLQRVPYIARVKEYGKSANLLGYRKSLHIAVEHLALIEKEKFRAKIERLFATPMILLNSFWDVALTNSNPLLHPCRLFGMWKNWDGKSAYSQHLRFYEDWDDLSSETLLGADDDFFELLKKLPVTPGAIPRLRDYYESPDAPALTRKLRSIPAFKGILAPMLAVPGGFIPDVSNRYFTEDIPFGMKIIKSFAMKYGVETPTIDRVLSWAEKLPPPPHLRQFDAVL